MKAIRIREFGNPEVLQLEEVEKPKTADGEVLIKVTAAGINFADTKSRKGDYPNTYIK